MSTKRLIVVFGVFVLMLLVPISALAQTDSDGDGLEDTVDRCPREAGPRENNGCPVAAQPPVDPPPTGPSDADGDGVPDDQDACPFVSGQGNQFGGVSGADGCPQDSDGDTIVDGLDRCPFEFGVPEKDGCPGEQPPDTPPDLPPAPTEQANDSPNLPHLPEDQRCVLATIGGDNVNVRKAPSLTAEIAGQINPQSIYPVLEKLETFEGMWYHIPLGWVFGDVVRVGGRCDQGLDEIPSRQDPTTPNDVPQGCDGFVGVKPLSELYVNITFFEWSPLAMPNLAWYELTLYDFQGDWAAGVGKGAAEPFASVDTSPNALGAGVDFFWKVTAYSNTEQVLCETPLYPVTRTTKAVVSPSVTVEDCADFAGLSPLVTLNAVSTPFEWTGLPAILYYDLRLYDINDVLVGQKYSVALNASLQTTSAAIGDGGTWSWEVSAYTADYELACATPRYFVTRSAEEPPVGGLPDVPGDQCEGFAALYPTEFDVIDPLPYELTQFSWSPGAGNLLYQPVLHNDDINYSYSLPGFSSDTTQNMPTGTALLGEGDNVWWEVVAIDAITLEEMCRTPHIPLNRAKPIPVIDPGKLPEWEVPFPTDGIILTDFSFDDFKFFACNGFTVLTFVDSLQWTQFHWVQISAAAGYRINVYDENQQWIEGWDTSGYAAYLITKLEKVGPKDAFWFDVQALTANNGVLCSTVRYFVQRDLEPEDSGISVNPDIVIAPDPKGRDISVIPNLELAPTACDLFVPVTPLDEFASEGETWFEWTELVGSYLYQLSIYNSDGDWMNGEYRYSAYGPYEFIFTGEPYIGAGDTFFWDVKAWDIDSNLMCTTPMEEVTRPAAAEQNNFGQGGDTPSPYNFFVLPGEAEGFNPQPEPPAQFLIAFFPTDQKPNFFMVQGDGSVKPENPGDIAGFNPQPDPPGNVLIVMFDVFDPPPPGLIGLLLPAVQTAFEQGGYEAAQQKLLGDLEAQGLNFTFSAKFSEVGSPEDANGLIGLLHKAGGFHPDLMNVLLSHLAQ